VDDDDVDIPELDDDDSEDVAWPGCRAEPPAPDRDRVVLLAHPFAADQAEWAVLSLDVDGGLSDTGQRLSAGRAPYGDAVFTPDGALAFAVTDDGNLVTFEVEGGEVAVVPAPAGDYYAARVVIEPSGEVGWIVDGNWAKNGGGLYRFDIGCDDATFGPAERVVEGKLPADLLLDPARDDRGLMVSREVPGAAAGDDVALLDWPPAGAATGGADAFGDDEASVSDAALTPDGRFALIGDYSAFSGIPNRVAIVELTADGVAPHQVLPDVYDPMALVPSPGGDAVLVVSGYGDAVFVISRDGDDFAFEGEPAYVGQSPQLPATGSVVERGELAGLVLVSENQGVRGVRFDGEGGVEDLGMLLTDTAISGALGIQP